MIKINLFILPRMEKSLIFSFNVLTLLVIFVLVAGTMGQGNTNKKDMCRINLDNQMPGSCQNKSACLSACKKRVEGSAIQEINARCSIGKICACYAPCPK
ncbi:hypothetical protein Bca4012_075586 [Brassica carinata]|uniref:Knottin scorpion toxin-like domain-containing protein n=1 Tax=Brassica oleracea var. oleracea TaxID=109376 RepID=A0A0D3D2S0_BRAOL